MRVVDFNTFTRLPSGTIFAPYTPSPWLGDDSVCLLSPGDTAPASFEIYDGCDIDYRDYRLFLIFEDADVERLIRVLEWARSGCEGPNLGDMEV